MDQETQTRIEALADALGGVSREIGAHLMSNDPDDEFAAGKLAGLREARGAIEEQMEDAAHFGAEDGGSDE